MADFIPPGRKLPHSIDAERAVLGAILVNNSAFERVSAVIQGEHLVLSEHRRIFEEIKSLIESGVTADFVTVKNAFPNGTLDAIGGLAYFATLADHAATPTNAEAYARIIHDHYTRREIIAACDEAISEAYGDDSGPDATEILGCLQSRISELNSGAGVAEDYGTWASDIEDGDIEWLWPEHIPLGMFTLVAGQGSAGKSSIMYELAAHISTGKPWPDGSPCQQGKVALLETEDGKKPIIKPRLVSAGSDLSQIAIFESKDEIPPPHNLAKWLKKKAIRLLVISPITHLIEGDQSSNSDTDVRASIKMINEACEEANCAFVGLGHITKDQSKAAIFRIMGSVAYVNAARCVFIVTKDEASKIHTLTATDKFNIGEKPPGWNFSVEHIGPKVCSTRINWLGKHTLSADDLLTQAHQAENSPSKLAKAKNIILEMIASAPAHDNEVKAAVMKEGISFDTFKRAREALKTDGIIEKYRICNDFFIKLNVA